MSTYPQKPADRSGAVTTGGTAQTPVAANVGRQWLFIQNIDAVEDLWVSIVGTAVVGAAGSVLLPAKGAWVFEDGQGFVPSSAVSVIAATTGHKFTILEA